MKTTFFHNAVILVTWAVNFCDGTALFGSLEISSSFSKRRLNDIQDCMGLQVVLPSSTVLYHKSRQEGRPPNVAQADKGP